MPWLLCFLKLVCFFAWLADRFHNFELTQNREEKKEIALRWLTTLNFYLMAQ
jgi:hypothetical protein